MKKVYIEAIFWVKTNKMIIFGEHQNSWNSSLKPINFKVKITIFVMNTSCTKATNEILSFKKKKKKLSASVNYVSVKLSKC